MSRKPICWLEVFDCKNLKQTPAVNVRLTIPLVHTAPPLVTGWGIRLRPLSHYLARPSEVTMNPTVTLPMSTPPKPMLEHAIRHLAYELYAQRGMADGHAVPVWLEAEAEVVY